MSQRRMSRTKASLFRAGLRLVGPVRHLPIRGRGRAAHEAHRRLGRFADFDYAVRLRRGDDLVLPMTSSQSWRAVFTGAYDDEVIAFLGRYIRPGSLVIDVGASLGLYTIALGRAAALVDAMVLAIEPMQRNAEILQANVHRNDLGQNVTVLHAALGSSEGTLELHSEPGGVGNAAATSGVERVEMERHDAAGGATHTEVVSVVRLDDTVLGFGRPVSLIKMDVEGFEFEVLAGGEATVTEHRPVLYAEMNLDWLTARDVPERALADWLTIYGYGCWEVAPERRGRFSDRRRVALRAISDTRERQGADLLLIPRERLHGSEVLPATLA